MRKSILFSHPAINTKWRVVDSHWVNVSAAFIYGATVSDHVLYPGTLADFLWEFGFEVPATIKYCIAENDLYYLKFRQSGGLIDIFINPLKN